jgi:N-methylhydantoinase A/oxoprolinase/acetone carboxylase beta subunit
MDGRNVVTWHKTATTADVSSGIIASLTEVLASGSCGPEDIGAVMIGTTHFTNAVVERKRLLEVAAVRIALPATQALPPMVDWPEDLREAIGNHAFFVHGGYEFDGRPIVAMREDEVRRLASDIGDAGIRSIALTSAFAPVNGDMEQRAAAILREELPDAHMTLSSEIGRIGLLERENATIMNACLVELALGVVSSFRTALDRLAISAPFYISQNDGTLMTAEFAEQYPVLTFASGPTNSMRGAAFLSGVGDAVVVDVGGTTSDVGVLKNGFPREASTEVEIGNVRTNFRMPDIVSFGLGGGSIVRQDDGEITVGPDSVGYELTSRGLVFGGDTLTTTDIAVAAGRADVGDRSLVAQLESSILREALARIDAAVELAVDRIKTSADPVPVVLVGGGTILLGDALAGASELVKPDHASVANAIGAAIAQVGGEIDRVFSLDGTTRADVVAAAREAAIAKAVEAGALPDTVEVVEVDEVPLTYLPGNATRMRVKAVGELELT